MGHYLCGIYNDSQKSIIILKDFSLLMTAVTASPVSVGGSEASLPANSFLVVLSCGLLLTKALVLIALFVLLTYRALAMPILSE